MSFKFKVLAFTKFSPCPVDLSFNARKKPSVPEQPHKMRRFGVVWHFGNCAPRMERLIVHKSLRECIGTESAGFIRSSASSVEAIGEGELYAVKKLAVKVEEVIPLCFDFREAECLLRRGRGVVLPGLGLSSLLRAGNAES
jgi:hypothetical protein